MHKLQSLPWCDPLELAAAVSEPRWVLLYSGAQAGYSGRYSLLAHRLNTSIEAEDFTAFTQALSADTTQWDNAWFGYLGYGLKNALETLPVDRPGWLALPALCMMRFHAIYQFDHEQKSLTRWADDGSEALSPVRQPVSPLLPPVISLRSNMSRSEYLAKAAHVIGKIHAGDLYQANLTRKFMGSFLQAPEPFPLFRALCQKSPAAYSAYMRMDETHILSSSPELFLRLAANGDVLTRPIKGTSPRHADADKDARSRDKLLRSDKDRAENLMITDLMRNDLSRGCEPGSVRTDSLFDVTSHANVHHMSSTVSAKRRADATALDVVRDCFPPGSMTGAPKIRAMALCSRLEREARGVYSGALGWFGGDGSAELSVVIRTLLLRGEHFEFQVGGGIVADSTPEGELTELLHKASGLCAALGIDSERLANL